MIGQTICNAVLDIPQRKHVYPASGRAKKIVHQSMTMDTLFSAVYPTQWSSAAAPEFHAGLDKCKAAGFKVIVSLWGGSPPSRPARELDRQLTAKPLDSGRQRRTPWNAER